jgi:hypothetical protein
VPQGQGQAHDHRGQVLSDGAHLIEQCIQEYNQYAEALGQSTWDPQQAIMRNPITDNQITHEIIKYGVDKSWLDAFGNFLTPESPGIDLLEVYCSADSQLTGQSIRQGLKAIHFGLNQGDLSYYEGRSRLYDILFPCRPPSCLAVTQVQSLVSLESVQCL